MLRTTRFVPILAVAVAGLVGGGIGGNTAAQAGTPMPDDPKAIVLRSYDAYNAGDVAAFDEIFAADWVDHPPPPGPGTDRENLKLNAAASRDAFPDLFFAVENLVVERDKVVVRSTVTGTHRGAFFGVPATDRRVTFPVIDVHRVAEDRIAETWHVEDWLSVLGRVGAFPPSPPDTAGTPLP